MDVEGLGQESRNLESWRVENEPDTEGGDGWVQVGRRGKLAGRGKENSSQLGIQCNQLQSKRTSQPQVEPEIRPSASKEARLSNHDSEVQQPHHLIPGEDYVPKPKSSRSRNRRRPQSSQSLTTSQTPTSTSMPASTATTSSATSTADSPPRQPPAPHVRSDPDLTNIDKPTELPDHLPFRELVEWKEDVAAGIEVLGALEEDDYTALEEVEDPDKDKSKLWAYLLHNLRRAVDDIYSACVSENDGNGCEMASAALELIETSSDSFRHYLACTLPPTTPQPLTSSTATHHPHRRHHLPSSPRGVAWEVPTFKEPQHLGKSSSQAQEGSSSGVKAKGPSWTSVVDPWNQGVEPEGEGLEMPLSPPLMQQSPLPLRAERQKPSALQPRSRVKKLSFISSDSMESSELGKKGPGGLMLDVSQGNESGRVAWADVEADDGDESEGSGAAGSVSLHLKLMSPDRKRKSPLETKQLAEEKHRRAALQRKSMDHQRRDRLARAEGGRQAAHQQMLDRSARLAQDAAERQERSCVLRDQHLRQRAERASQESKKVREVMFINEVDAQNRKLSLKDRLQRKEDRRNEALDQIRSRQKEESLALAAEARRKALEEERQMKLEESARRKAAAEVKREEERRALELAREVKKEQKETQAQAQAQQQAKTREDRRQALQERLSAASARRQANIAYIRERANSVGSDPHSHLSSPDPHSAETLTPRQRGGVWGGGGVQAVLDLKVIAETCTTVSTTQAQAKQAHDARRKRAKKLRTRLAAARHTDPEEVMQSASSGVVNRGSLEAQARLTKLRTDIQRHAGRDNLAALEASLSDAFTLLSPDRANAKISATVAPLAVQLDAARTTGLLQTVAELAVEPPPGASPRLIVLILRLLRCQLVGSAASCQAALCQNLLPPLIPRLLMILEDSEDEGSHGASGPSASPVGGGPSSNQALLSPPSSAHSVAVSTQEHTQAQLLLEVVVLVLRAPVRCSAGAQMLGDLVALLLASSLVHRLCDLFSLFDRSGPQASGPSANEPLPPLVEQSVRVLQALADLSAAQPACSSSSSLSAAMKETALAGLPSLLTAILLSAEREQRMPVLTCVSAAADLLPHNFVPLATQVLRAINAFARYDLPAAQEAMAAPDLKVELYHLLSFLLSFGTFLWSNKDKTTSRPPVGGDEVEALLGECLVLTGQFCLLQPEQQAVLRWGQAGSTILHKLAHMPFPYFCDESLSAILFPTIIAATFQNNRNNEVIQRELNLEMIRLFLDEKYSESTSGRRSSGIKADVHFQLPDSLYIDARKYYAFSQSNP